ncbi:Cof-type HAD-IIB family hydrolase [Anaerobium acetethylicum]|uniref:Cof subfamily of IIB subfamily of haloacid dehalogenase superfamily/HAD-superfamily hydrolase, subfamily IIB n=1 Tax=Anaerobium acetethylicum TaxID=1619234 RepID=A0A1D3TW20_9FIRM|nr:Cof-type HAD-IIB family hydrolase [Anaerobium acetethylicum]SCP98416.1 hypothetical protein SAMN05421730_102029 [Anaerobium acetethylicum]
MKSSIVFFDIDGTIFDFQHGVIESTKKAIKELIENGHYAVLCTGRSRARVYDDIFMDIGFSGVVAGCGTYVEYEKEILCNHEVPHHIAKSAVKTLRKYGLVPVLEGSQYMYYDLDEYTTDIDYYRDKIEEKVGINRKPITGNENTLYINKISAKKTPNCNLEMAIKELSPYYYPIQHEGITVEFVPHGFSKASGIEFLIKKLGKNKRNTFAFGDSINDFDMIQYVEHGIAMGNSSKTLKKVADYITTDRLNDGIYNGLKHFELI